MPSARSGPGRVKSRTRRWLMWLVVLVGVGLALKFLTGFPWQVTFAALLDADRWLLVIALAVNLSSLVLRGGVAPDLEDRRAHSWRVAQEANLVGAAVNDLSVAVAGEAPACTDRGSGARYRTASAVSSVVWPAWRKGLAAGAVSRDGAECAAARAVAAGGNRPAWGWRSCWYCCSPGAAAGRRSPTGCRHRFSRDWPFCEPWNGWPTAVADRLWALQIGPPSGPVSPRVARTHVPVSLAASFTALIVVNLGGLLRPTPANVGVTQAALVVGLLPFGVAPGMPSRPGWRCRGYRCSPCCSWVRLVHGVAPAQARIRARLKSDGERGKRVTRLDHARLPSAACLRRTGCSTRPARRREPTSRRWRTLWPRSSAPSAWRGWEPATS